MNEILRSRTCRIIFILSFALPTLTQANLPPLGPSQVPIQNVQKEGPVQCTQAYALSQWAYLHFGGKKPAAFPSSEYAQKAAKALIEKWDPKHLLHTQKEVAEFQAKFTRDWNAFAKYHSCTALSRDIQLHLKAMASRLDSLTQALNTQKVFEFPLKIKDNFSDELPKYETFVKNLPALTIRIQEALKKALKGISDSYYKAFNGNQKFLIRSYLDEQLSFTDSKKSPEHWLLAGALGALDPYTAFLTEQEFQELNQDLAGTAKGIGIRVAAIPSGLLVRQVLAKSPAETTGDIAVGDWLLEVNGKVLTALDDQQKRDSLNPENNTDKVVLKVRKANGRIRTVLVQRRELELEEARVSIQYIPGQISGSEIAILRIPSFYGSATWDPEKHETSVSEDVERALNEIKSHSKKVTAIVLDLRGNPGGFLEEAVTIGSFFLAEKTIVGVSQGSEIRSLHGRRTEALYSGPLVIAVDEDSASASEVLAGALKDHKRATVIAEKRTYGKGSVQRVFPIRLMSDTEIALTQELKMGAVKLTTSLFYSPKGHCPEGSGVLPDMRAQEKNEALEDSMATALAKAIHSEVSPSLVKAISFAKTLVPTTTAL